MSDFENAMHSWLYFPGIIRNNQNPHFAICTEISLLVNANALRKSSPPGTMEQVEQTTNNQIPTDGVIEHFGKYKQYIQNGKCPFW